jgi:hypothetical protein
VADNVILHVAETLTVNMTLEVGRVSQQVTVSAKPPLLDSGTDEVSRYVTVQEYKSWPVVISDGQRQIQDFIFTSLPGTTGSTFSGSINGGQTFSHEILVEGISLGRAEASGATSMEYSPSSEAISEFNLQTGAVSAQYNGGQTAVANFNIKSGTNDLHGSLFYYAGNDALDAQDTVSKAQGLSKPPLHQNNFGWGIGGPVYIPKVYNGRNKTFFFTNFEWDRLEQIAPYGLVTLPTPAFKNGDFSQLLNPAYTGNPMSGTQVGTDALGRPIIFGQIYNPLTTRSGPGGSIIRDPFPGNIIPQSQWDPVATNVVQNAGIANPQFDTMLLNMPGDNCNGGFGKHSEGVKVDHDITSNNRISGYYNKSYLWAINTPVGPPCWAPAPPAASPASTWGDQDEYSNMVRLSLNSVLTPSISNRFAAGYNSFRNQVGALASTINQGWAGKIGVQNTSPNFFPAFSFTGPDYQGGTTPQLGEDTYTNYDSGSYIYQDDLTWIHSKHTFHFGYEYRRYIYDWRQLTDSGNYYFSPQQTDLPGYLDDTGHAFASFMVGGAQSATHAIYTLTQGFRDPYHAFYAMDDWKVTPKLTVNLGLRWEIIPPFYEVTGRMSEVDLSVPNPGAGNRPGALVFASPGGRFNDTYFGELGPRLGFAYQLSNKMVIRSGYAMMNTPPIANNWGFGGFTYGFNGSVNVPAGSNPDGFVDDPAIYLSKPFPSLSSPLPDKDPASANYTNYVTTTARNANRPGYVGNWNLTVQYLLPKQTVLDVAYLGNKGTRMWGGVYNFSELDGLPTSLLSMGDVLNAPVSQYPQYIPYAGFPTTNKVAQALRPYPQYYGVEEAFPYNQDSNYDSMQITVTRHLTAGLGFIAAYTWSKALGTSDANGPAGQYSVTIQDYYNRRLERSVTSFNLPQTFKLTWVYDTPIGKGKKINLGWGNYILGGWQIAGIQSYLSGMPVAVSESGLNTPPGFGAFRPDALSGEPKTVGGVPSKVDVFDGTAYLNPAAFARSPLTANGTPLRVGTAPRFLPTVRGPAPRNETFRLSKKFPLKEKTFFQLGMSVINPFNRTFPFIADTTVGDSAFGQVYEGAYSNPALSGGTTGGRTIQLDARVEF